MSETTKNYSSVAVKELAGSQVEITGSIPVATWENYRTQAIRNINQSVTVDGFRKGFIPENILISKVGEMAILEEMAELALPKSYVDIIVDQKIEAVGKPSIQVTKLAAGNPLEFKAVTAVMPKITLPDYKALAAKEAGKVDPDAEKVSEKDLEEALLKVRKAHAPHEGHDHDKMTPEEHEKAVMENLPELNEDFVKKIGDFNSVDEFKSRLSDMLLEEKKSTARDKRRLRIADAIGEATKADLPDVMVESELARTQSQFEADIEKMGVKLDDYLKHAKKSLEDIRKEWRPYAEKKAKLQLILNMIAEAENIKPSPAEVEAETEQIVTRYKDADRERASIYAETVLTNDKVFEFLERQGQK